MQENHSKSFFMSDFMWGGKWFRIAPFVGYSASTLIPKLKKKGYLEVSEKVQPKKIFVNIWRPMNKYTITPLGLNLKLK